MLCVCGSSCWHHLSTAAQSAVVWPCTSVYSKKMPESCCIGVCQPCRMLDTITCRCRLLPQHIVCFRYSKPAKVAQAPDTTYANPDATATTADTDTATPTQASCGGIVFFSHTA